MTLAEQLQAIAEELGFSPQLPALRGLQVCPEATELEVVERGDDGREHRLLPAAAQAWRRMKAAARDDGIELQLVSAFRSIDRQAQIFRRKLAAGASIEAVLRVNAPPGYSEHHGGCAVDLGTPGSRPLQEAFEETPAFGWLCRHAGRFGFCLSYPRGHAGGYDYEPWHWCYHGEAERQPPSG